MELIAKKVQVQYHQETGWKKPFKIKIGKKEHKVKKITSRWEEHTFGDPWWQRRHRVHYEIKLETGETYQIYWNRGASGKGDEWILLKKLT